MLLNLVLNFNLLTIKDFILSIFILLLTQLQSFELKRLIYN